MLAVCLEILIARHKFRPKIWSVLLSALPLTSRVQERDAYFFGLVNIPPFSMRALFCTRIVVTLLMLISIITFLLLGRKILHAVIDRVRSSSLLGMIMLMYLLETKCISKTKEDTGGRKTKRGRAADELRSDSC